MKNKSVLLSIICYLLSYPSISFAAEYKDLTFKAGHASLQEWLLPDAPPYPENNPHSEASAELGKMLFFDPRIGGDGNMSCASCHNPLLGWSDALPTAKGFKSQVLGRASPVITNSAFNSLQMWDGRKKSLEDQAIGPMEASVEMQTNFTDLLNLLNHTEDYQAAFEKAYPEGKVFLNKIPKITQNPFLWLLDHLVEIIFLWGTEPHKRTENLLFNTMDVEDNRLRRKEHVWGFNIGKDSVAYTEDFIRQQQNLINVTVGGRDIVVAYDSDYSSVGVYYNDSGSTIKHIDFFGESDQGKLLRVETVKAGLYWCVWVNFYPETDLNRLN